MYMHHMYIVKSQEKIRFVKSHIKTKISYKIRRNYKTRHSVIRKADDFIALHNNGHGDKW